MNTFLNYLVPGLSNGSVYALVALGLVLTYKTSGVFNFAHGGVAATAAYMFYEFRVLQDRPWPVAFGLSLLIVGVFGGLVLERLAALLSSAPTVMVVVATVGLLVFLQSLMTAIYGSANILFREFLPTGGFTLGDVLVTGGDLIIIGFSLGSALILFLFFGRTRLGKATTAVVDDPDLLSLQKTNPAVVRRMSWVLGSSFAAISGMLLAPRLGVSVNTLILLVIAAYGAAAVGRFENLPLTVLGALVIGVLVAYLPSQTTKSSNLIVQLLPSNLPFLVLFVVFLVVPARKLTERGVRNARRLRPIRTFSPRVTATGLTLLLVGMVALPLIVNSADVAQYSSALGYMIIFASLGMITWMSGQISLCHLGFAAIGATTTGHMLAHGVSWPLAVLIGGLITVPAGAIVAIPAIRLAGIYVAIATFGFGIVLQQVFYPSFLMFGVLNRVEVPRPTILGVSFASDQSYYYLALIATVLACTMILLVRRSRLGTLLRAMSDSPVALDAHGANTVVMKVVVFCMAAFLAGIGGAVLAGVPESASGSAGGTFDFTVSLVFVAVIGFAGRRPVLSPFLAAFFFQVIKTYPGFDDPTVIKYQGVIFGLLAIFVAVAPALNLGGLFGRRGKERDDSAGPVRERLVSPPPRPVTVRVPAAEGVLLGGGTRS
jgi:branched-subunit amino acid ABC-type transport system permease component